MRSDPDAVPTPAPAHPGASNGANTAIIGTATIATLAIAAIVVAFSPSAPVVSVIVTAAFVGSSLAMVAYIGFARPLLTELARERSGRIALDDELRTARSRRGFVEQLDYALDMADTEDEALDIVGRALSMLLPDRDNFVLLAPPRQPRVTWAIPIGPEGLEEPVILGEAMRCSALSLGRTVETESSGALDACPHLGEHHWEVSSLCVPIRIGEQHLGVAHSAGPAGDLPDDEARRLLEVVTRRVGVRIAALRASRQQTDHVAVDPLTKLPNHTVVQRRLRELMGDHTPFSIAFCDLDRFSGYNETHGSDNGDQALRIFAEVMSATLRPGDVIARFAGDRFLCLFPNCSAVNASAAMERVRESLVLELSLQEIAPFTASVGIADSDDADVVDDLLEVADVALAVAKNSGGNRVVLNDFDEIRLNDLP